MLLPDDHSDRVLAAMLAAIPEPFFIFDENGRYVQILGGVDRSKYHDGRHLVGKRIHEVMRAELADAFVAQIREAIRREAVIHYVYPLAAADILGSESLPGPQGRQWFEAHISPIAALPGHPRMVVWVAFSITELHTTIAEKNDLIDELRQALAEVKTLQGILPICSHCKKIRDDRGYWNQLESYIQSHSEADFSHGICEECARIHYPDFAP